MYYIRNPEIAYRKETFGGTVLNRKITIARELNATAARIFECCDGDKTAEDIAKIISSEFKGKKFSDILSDTKNVLDKMIRYGLVKLSEKKILPKESFYEKYKHFKIKSEIRPPVWADIEVTLRCNLKCVHCFANAGTGMENELSTAEFKKLLERLKDVGIMAATFTGGEPLLRKDIFELAKYANSLDITTVLFSNGFLVNKENAELIKENFQITQISVDGSIPEIHDKFRGVNGSWEKATNAIKILAELGQTVLMSTCFIKPDEEELRKRAELALNLGAKRIRVGLVQPSGRGTNIAIKRDASLVRDFILMLQRLSHDYRNELEVEVDESFEKLFEMQKKGGDIPLRKTCGAATHRLSVDPDGNIRPCIILVWPEFIAGNMREKPVKDIVENSEVFKTLRALNVDEFETCGLCKYKYICAGACRAIAYDYAKTKEGEKDFAKALNKGFPYCFQFEKL